MKTNNFNEQVLANEQAQKHAQEIRQTRIGGLGGSDAGIVYKIGLNGLGALTSTDMRRLAVMTGKVEQDDWSGNAYTHAGHVFEDFAEKNLPFGNDGYEREKVLECKLARNFRTFAHADFVTGEMCNDVIECKFVQKPTDKVTAEYYAQLQWYFLLGAQSVTLYHGQGTADPFEVETGELVQIERDETTIKILLAGIKTLDEALTKGWEPDTCEKIELINTPESVQRAFDEMAGIKAQEAQLKARKDEATAVLKQYAEDWGYSSIFSTGEEKHQAIYTRASVAMTFDTAKFLKEHPEFDRPEYYKKTSRSACITFK